MRSIIFCKRTIKELLRDPLSYIFCLGFPIVMLIIMSVVNNSIPAEAHMDIFQIQNLAPGIAVFGLTFVMLFACLQVSKDRTTAFLTRLYASPMRPVDFIAGYTLPLLIIAVLQAVINFVTSFVIGLISGYTFQLFHVLLCLVALLPTALLFIAFGLFAGSLLNDKAAPGICSLLITAACILGGIWMDVDSIGGILKTVCQVLPFYHGVQAARMAMQGEYSQLGKPFFIILIYALVIYTFAVLAFQKKMRSDLK
ncbi:MAG: ABC transporter permease [Lachnospiraceae bacterium]|nr:ABC transporter permease [Lachnospiraceae bacterium]